MAHEVPARLSPAEGRKFGVQVGLAFLLLAAFLGWRGRTSAAPWLGGVGGLLVVAGLAVPRLLGPVYRAWMGLAQALSKITTPVFMAVVFFLVVVPIGWLMRMFGRNPLMHHGSDGGYWMPLTGDAATPRNMERQF